ncbi:hypothetical protein DS66_00260 [Mesotoga sp. SC_3PWM13N19]|nr:hypothetical protein DS66_00260 [Mesotoga sp. SC_3PWM13N19]HAY98940.1 hypothetical protein [Mesotoga sp.]
MILSSFSFTKLLIKRALHSSKDKDEGLHWKEISKVTQMVLESLVIEKHHETRLMFKPTLELIIVRMRDEYLVCI